MLLNQLLEPGEGETFTQYRISEKTLTTHQRRVLLRVLRQFKQVFSQDAYDLGECNIAVHRIHTCEAPTRYTPGPERLPAPAVNLS